MLMKRGFAMKEIRCPKCNNFFEPDEAGYASVVKQIRDDEFNNEIARIENRMVKRWKMP